MPHRPPVPNRPNRPVTRVGPRLAAVLALATAATASYTVQPGDTLSGIAIENRVSTRALAEVNGLTDPNRIIAGRTLALPAAAPAAGGATGTVHIVAAGETLSHLATRHGQSATAIAEANGIVDRDRIRVGQRLWIPAAAAPAAASSPSAAPAQTASRADTGALIERTARAHGWNPAFVKALAWQESGWSNARVSSAGAVGIMQVLPSTGVFVSERLAGRSLNLDDPADNVLAGVLFLDHLHRLTGGDAEQILAGYYQGLASVEQNGVYDSTRQYIANVLALRERF